MEGQNSDEVTRVPVMQDSECARVVKRADTLAQPKLSQELGIEQKTEQKGD